MTIAECLITGCEFEDLARGCWVHGDLHRVGTTYVFNAVMNQGETAWEYGEPLHPQARILSTGGPFFERRGVLVVQACDAELNAAAKTYLYGGGPGRLG